MAYLHLTQTVADAFNALADEVQILSDRKTILEHKLRFAHEQFQYLADKYAPAAPEIEESIAKLQLPAQTTVDDTLPVPLPKHRTPQSQAQVALIIRDGRRAANKLVASLETSMSTTALEQDFTVEDKKEPKPETGPDLTSNQSEDPVCVAMCEEETFQQDAVNEAQPSKCPIRFLDSPQEIAQYVEVHKNEIPRSHEVCVRRYQGNEQQVRKLDAKYGNVVSMIEDLSHLHKPMLPGDEERTRRHSNTSKNSNDRVESWAHAVTVSASTDPEVPAEPPVDIDDGRQSHFDRPLKEVRVGESPSRPWGISVPTYNQPRNEPMSPPPAPVRMPSPARNTEAPAKPAGKCPFDHTAMKQPAFAGLNITSSPDPQLKKDTVSNTQLQTPLPPMKEPQEHHASQEKPTFIPQPTFINPDSSKAPNGPQMVFTGPVFIGYPMEQAIQFMNQYQRTS
ncbi:hypothetical protein HDV63DRAFT_197002 [Trichoderma sp. SZMC 28014]